MAEPDRYPDVDRVEVLPLIPSGALRILDVGCWQGGFGVALKASRPDVVVHGVEADTSAAASAMDRYDRVWIGEFPEVPGAGEAPYDCIVFNDVLEHMVDPWAALRAAAGLLGEGGRVVASIPNLRYWPVLGRLVIDGTFTYEGMGVLDRTHLRFFTRRSMLELFAECGFEVEVQVPITLMSMEGRRAQTKAAVRLLQIIRPGLATDLRTMQYGLVAAPNASR